MKTFSADQVKLWGYIVLYAPVNADLGFHRFETFCREANSLQGLAVAECERDLTPRQKTRQKNLTRNVIAYAKSIGAEASVGGDPRGWIVKVRWPDRGANTPSNTWGGPEEGWGVG